MPPSWKMNSRPNWRFFRLGIAGSIAPLYLTGVPGSIDLAVAQIVPDNTLGTEPSVVAPTANVRGLPGILIQGGARRGANLFQSFSDFNVGTGQRVYFANPSGVETILSRVTGRNPSSILGTLGVDGLATLFLINPNGILFGQNARLDIAGSFVATTTDRLEFGNGLSFSATNPQAPPPLTVSLRPGLQYGTNYQGDITNAGNLVVGAGQTLVLAGRNVTSTGLLATPGGTVQVLGDRVSLLDNARIDVASTAGGGTVLIGGDFQGQGSLPTASETLIAPNVTINADGLSILRPSPDNRPPTPANGGRVIVWSDDTTQFYGTITARGGAIGGDGGFVEVSGKENLVFNGWIDASAPNGRPGTLLLDPRDIEIVPGNGIINIPGEAYGTKLPGDNIALTQIGADQITTIANSGTPISLVASNNITFNAQINITNPGIGLTATAGNNIFVNSNIFTTRGDITLTAQGGNVTINGAEIDTNPRDTGIGGNIEILARNQISVSNSLLRARSDGTGGFSTIRLISSQGSVALNNTIVSTTNFGAGFAGDIFIDAPNQIEVLNNSQVFSRGDFGRVLLGVSNEDELDDRRTTSLPEAITISNSLLNSRSLGNRSRGRIGVFASNQVTITGSELTSESSNTDTDTFNRIEVFARNGNVSLDRARISAISENTGFAGDVILSAGNALSITNSNFQNRNPITNERLGIFSQGNEGRVLIGRSDNFAPNFDPNYPTFSPRTITIDNSTVFVDNLTAPATAVNMDAGVVSLRAIGDISLARGTRISSSSFLDGDAGGVQVQTRGDVTLRDSDIQSNLEAGGRGESGLVRVDARSVFLFTSFNSRVAAQIQTLVRGPDPDNGRPIAGQGNAGNVIVNTTDTIRVIGINQAEFRSAIFSSILEDASGIGGSVILNGRSIHVRNGGRIDASNFGVGAAGNVLISALGVWVDNNSIITARSRDGQGGNVFLNVPGSVILGRNGNVSTSAFEASQQFLEGAGNIAIGSGNILSFLTFRGSTAYQFDNSTLLVAGKTFRDNNIFSTGELADGGFIRVGAFRLQDIARRTDSLFTNDITAESSFGVSGDVVVSAVNIFPSFRADPLPERYTPPRISEGCDPRVRQETSKFTIIGRGGLPADPTEILSPDTLAGTGSTPTATVPLPQAVSNDNTIVPARGWVQQTDGSVRLVAHATNLNAPVPNLTFPIPGSCNAP